MANAADRGQQRRHAAAVRPGRMGRCFHVWETGSEGFAGDVSRAAGEQSADVEGIAGKCVGELRHASGARKRDAGTYRAHVRGARSEPPGAGGADRESEREGEEGGGVKRFQGSPRPSNTGLDGAPHLSRNLVHSANAITGMEQTGVRYPPGRTSRSSYANFCAKAPTFPLSQFAKSSYIKFAQAIRCRQLTWVDGKEKRFHHLAGRVVSCVRRAGAFCASRCAR